MYSTISYRMNIASEMYSSQGALSLLVMRILSPVSFALQSSRRKNDKAFSLNHSFMTSFALLMY